jgi:HSP20 family protein
VKETDLDVTLTGQRLTIAGKRSSEHEEKTDTYYTYERSYGDFSRSFTLPDGIDAKSMTADLKEGVLTVGVRKTPEAESRKIPVQTPAKRS